MGLYDWVYIKRKCPNCGEIEISQFQTKDLGCNFSCYEIGDEVPTNSSNIDFVDICSKCNCFIESFGNVINGKLKNIEIYKYSMNLKESNIIEKSYKWDFKNQKFIN